MMTRTARLVVTAMPARTSGHPGAVPSWAPGLKDVSFKACNGCVRMTHRTRQDPCARVQYAVPHLEEAVPRLAQNVPD